jgi:cellulose synthase/poly-beta-1,6-N-acetylglucosamine synthase-like glycosyltransferase
VTLFHWIAGCILGLVWLSRVIDAGFGVPRLPDISLPQWDRQPPQPNPKVAIIVPARNEEAAIEEALKRLLTLDYDNYQVVVVDDRSTDRTGEIMDTLAATSAGRLKVVHVKELPPGWLGKPHAMWNAARETNADWLLFTDADILFRPDTLRRAVAYAEAEHADHLVVLPQVIMHRFTEKMMIAFFQLLFVFGHRPWKVSDPKTKDHMGVGAFNMVRRSTYEAVGTFQRLRMEVVDDMKLGKVVKEGGYSQRVVFGDDMVRVRWAHGARGVIDNLTKNFFAVMSFQTWRALLACAGMAILNYLPFIGVLIAPGWARLPYAVALASMFFLYSGIWKQGDIHPWFFFLHPVSTTLFIYTMLRSTFVTLSQGGVIWRGTLYPLEELRKGLV